MMKKLLVLLTLLALVLCGCTEAAPPALPEPTASPTAAPAAAAEDILTVHYIDVGQGDCALIECGGEYLLIDGGYADYGRKVVSYLDSLGVEALDYVVCTHAHDDHVGGLASVLAVFPTETVWSTTRTDASWQFQDFVHYADQQGRELTIPEIGEAFSLGSAEFKTIGPLRSYPEDNNTSLVITLTHGENTFLFTGDMERDPEQDLLEAGVDVKADVLKVGHHGSSDATSYRFLYEVDPEYAIISCGRDNDYGHPHESLSARLRDAGVTAFRTDELGTILAVSDGSTITMTWEHTHNKPAEAEEADSTLVGNRNSKILHAMSCDGLPKEKNRVYFESYDEAMEAGYIPCGSCLG